MKVEDIVLVMVYDCKLLVLTRRAGSTGSHSRHRSFMLQVITLLMIRIAYRTLLLVRTPFVMGRHLARDSTNSP